MPTAQNDSPNNAEAVRNLGRYDECIASVEAFVDKLPPGQLADRYHEALSHALATLSQHRRTMQALFAAALAEDSGLDILRGQRAERLARAFHRLVLASEDALREPKARDLGIALYTVYALVVLFWLYDRSPEAASTQKLLKLMRDLFKLARPMFFLPMIPQGIARLAEIILPELRRAPSEGAAAQDDPRDSEHQDLDIHRD